MVYEKQVMGSVRWGLPQINPFSPPLQPLRTKKSIYNHKNLSQKLGDLHWFSYIYYRNSCLENQGTAGGTAQLRRGFKTDALQTRSYHNYVAVGLDKPNTK